MTWQKVIIVHGWQIKLLMLDGVPYLWRRTASLFWRNNHTLQLSTTYSRQSTIILTMTRQKVHGWQIKLLMLDGVPCEELHVCSEKQLTIQPIQRTLYFYTTMESNPNITSSEIHHALDGHQVAKLIFLPLLIVIGLVGNLLVCMAILRKPKLHKVVNYFVFSLALCDLLVCAFVMPLAIYVEVNVDWYLGSGLCYFWILMDVLLCTASIWNLCLVAIDRYLAIAEPIKYAKIRTPRNAILAIVSIWPLAFIIALLIVLTAHNQDDDQDFLCQIVSDPSTGILSAIVAFYLPCVVILVLYTRIFVIIKQKTAKRKNSNQAVKLARQQSTGNIGVKKTTRQQSICPNDNTSSSVQDTGPCSSSSPESAATSKTSVKKSFKRRWTLRRSSSVAVRREMKTAIVLSIVVLAFIGCWLPYFIIYLVMLNEDLISENLLIAFHVASWLGWCNSIINPLIYTVFNEHYRMAFIDILLCKKA